MKRRTFLEVIFASAAGVLTGGFQNILAAVPEAGDSTFELGGDLLVNRLGFGAMRLTGEGIWGWPPDRENAKKFCGAQSSWASTSSTPPTLTVLKRMSFSLPKRCIPIRKDW